MRTEGVKLKEKRENIFSARSECVSPPHLKSNLNLFFFCSHIFTFAVRRLYTALFLSSFQGFSRPSSRRHCRRRVMISEHLHASSQNRCRSITSRASAALCWRGFFVFFVLGIGGCVFHPPSHPTTTLTSPATYPSNLLDVRLSDLLFDFHEDSVSVSFVRLRG